MPFSCTIEERCVHVAWREAISVEDLREFGREMPRIGRTLGRAPDVIHTFEEVTGLGFDPSAAYEYSMSQKAVAIPNPIRAAMVATTKENEYLATIFIKLNRAPNLEMRVFFDEASARVWLARE